MNRSNGSKVISKKQKFEVFYCHDLDLEHMTFTLKLDPDIVMTYHHTKMRSIGQSVQKLVIQKHRHRDSRTNTQTDV